MEAFKQESAKIFPNFQFGKTDWCSVQTGRRRETKVDKDRPKVKGDDDRALD